jgi:hypothetical protein
VCTRGSVQQHVALLNTIFLPENGGSVLALSSGTILAWRTENCLARSMHMPYPEAQGVPGVQYGKTPHAQAPACHANLHAVHSALRIMYMPHATRTHTQ